MAYIPVIYDTDTREFRAAPDDWVVDVLSKEEGNYARFGNDKGIFIDGNDILSNEANNALGISHIDGKIYFNNESVGPPIKLSGDPCNILNHDAQNAYFVFPADTLSGDPDQIIRVETCGLLLTIDDLISATAGNALVKDTTDGKLYATGGGSNIISVSSPEFTETNGYYLWRFTNPAGTGPCIIQVREASTSKLVYPDVEFDDTTQEINITFDAVITGPAPAGAFTALILV